MLYLSLEQIEEQALKRYPPRKMSGVTEISHPNREDKNYRLREAYKDGLIWMQRRLSENQLSNRQRKFIMTQQETITIPRSFLEEIENTLRIQNNINRDKKTGETCQDPNIKQSLNIVRKLLAGAELTGMERLEKLQHPPLPANLNEAAERFLQTENNLGALYNDEGCIYESAIPGAFKAGALWMARQGVTFEDTVVKDEYMGYTLAETIWNKAVLVNKFNDGDNVIVQIRKKE